MGVREEKKKENRRLILEAAKSVFARKGYHNASISDIIRDTGLSRGTFYLYYKDKEEIFRKLTANLYMQLFADILKLDLGAEALRGNYRETVARGTASLFRTLQRHGDLVRIVFNSPAGIDPQFDQIIQRYQNEMFAVTLNVVRKGIDYDIIKTDRDAKVARLIYGGIKELVLQRLLQVPFTDDIDDLARLLVDVFERGIVDAQRPPDPRTL